jgi:hypothetical protein
VPPEDLPHALDPDQRVAAAIDLVPEGDGRVGDRSHGSTVPLIWRETKVEAS